MSSIVIFHTCVWCTKNVKFNFRWGKKPWDQKQETGNDCDVISGLKVSGKTDFSGIFLFSYKQRTFVQFFAEFISSQSTSFPGSLILPGERGWLTIRKWLRDLFSAKLKVLKSQLFWLFLEIRELINVNTVFKVMSSTCSGFPTCANCRCKS